MAIRKPSPNLNCSFIGDRYFEVASERIRVKVDIPNPEFIVEHPGYIAHSYKVCGHSNIVLTRYKATSITNLDYDSFSVIDEKTNGKFKASDSLMIQVSKTVDNGVKMNSECQFRGKFGSLSDTEVMSVVNVIQNYYNVWRSFPNETSYDDVLKCQRSLGEIQRMKNEESAGWIKNQIEEARAEMDRLRKQIEKYEKEENQIYEEAADAMNMLEEKGYDPEEVFREQDTINHINGEWFDAANWVNSITIDKNHPLYTIVDDDDVDSNDSGLVYDLPTAITQGLVNPTINSNGTRTIRIG